MCQVQGHHDEMDRTKHNTQNDTSLLLGLKVKVRGRSNVKFVPVLYIANILLLGLKMAYGYVCMNRWSFLRRSKVTHVNLKETERQAIDEG